jgi:hypothetical protein
LTLICHSQHEAHAVGVRVGREGKWEKQPSAGSEIVKPGRSHVRRAGVDKNRVIRLRVVLSAIGLQNLNVIKMCKILTRSLGEVWIYLDTSDMAFRPNYCGGDRRVVTDAASDMKNVISFFEFERFKPQGDAARVTVV